MDVSGLVMTGSWGRMISSNIVEPVPPVLDALMLALNVPVCVGVPEINPVKVFIFKPGGRPVAP